MYLECYICIISGIINIGFADINRLKQTELLLSGSEDLVLLDLQDVESDRLGQRSALTGGDDITFLDVESRGAVASSVTVSLLESIVLLDVVQVGSSDNNGVLHLTSGDAHTSSDVTSDANISGERTLLVNVLTLLSFLRSGETKTNVGVVSLGTSLLRQQSLGADKDGVLLLESFLSLISHLVVVSIYKYLLNTR